MSSHSHNHHENPNPNPHSPQKPPISASKRHRLPDIWYKDQALKHAILKMKLNSLSPQPQSPPSDSSSEQSVSVDPPVPDSFSAFSDELMLRIFSKLPVSQCVANLLVCKRWLHLNGRLIRSVKILDFGFVESGRVFHRFPNLTDIDLVRGCVKSQRDSGIFVTNKLFSGPGSSRVSDIGFGNELLSKETVDSGLRLLAEGYPNLRRLVAVGAGERGLMSVAQECETLQELELHCCDDISLKGISGCRNLQIVKLVGSVEGLYSSVVSDIGLTLLAQGCRRLVKLELYGCEGSYDGIKAIGQCCQMLEELTFSDHRMDGGWLSALSFCRNLKTLTIRSCKNLDSGPGPDEHLGSCPTLEELRLQWCQMRNKKAVKALFTVCKAVREIVMQDCWGMENDIFNFVSVCRRVRILSLEGCSLLTVGGLEAVVLSLKELQMLRVESCRNVKDKDITPAMASLFSVLKELKWRPDSRSILSACLKDTGVRNKGGRFFNRLKS